ncbi:MULTISPECIES: amino acid ABC transporter permease [unclassified Enterococcus]|uniref:amino acid ABC transporter permease n=1 Tax=unclassified Enterococcus TaxID=2608891 RepID=UPI0015551523|nr:MULTISPECIES: amino acid ABC transporter permease [unclassified Enterococcus]MBS7577134.1 amino acid ABC transporter permease [Enterococcus sp. MMGLQ5-2]MBS7584419.1 amino acid ABC transporter permease [Enterococcus sp. MMGLQ5-1]NPD12274.1 amino acid ABC transporter permease [Enterococcus sp. MMGLQ5-1]NPD36968.1 amino acid ABC transporter permease [Enterococcus sp. MMGLQ5-2]
MVEFLDRYGSFLWNGAVMTIILSVVSMIFALILGGVLTALRMSQNKIIHYVTVTFIEIIRGLPMLVILFLCFYGIPMLGIQFPDYQIMGVDMSRFAAVLVGLTVGESVFVSEIFRSGIQSIDPGQLEGARSIGFSKWQSYRYVVLPQAIRNILPAIANEFANNIKSSSQASVIGVADLLFAAQTIQGISYKPFQAVVAAGAIYLLFTFSITRVVSVLERKMSRKSRA